MAEQSKSNTNKNAKVLVVDDFETVRLFLRNALSELGFHNVHEASDGAEAFEMIEQAYDDHEPFGLVFCDWNMPEMTGLELLTKLRSLIQFQVLPFVMVTAESEASAVAQAMRAGCTNFIAKPFTVDGIRLKLETVFKAVSKVAS